MQNPQKSLTLMGVDEMLSEMLSHSTPILAGRELTSDRTRSPAMPLAPQLRGDDFNFTTGTALIIPCVFFLYDHEH